MEKIEFKRRKPRRSKEEWKSSFLNILVKVVGDTLKAKLARAFVLGVSISVGSYTAAPSASSDNEKPVAEAPKPEQK